MNCAQNIVSDIEERAWVHHIPRLMVLSNLALISGTNPQEFLDWMQSAFIDASDWVMVPNVIGMGVHADGGTMMTKPYAAGGAYISRMSNYCGSCVYNPKERPRCAAFCRRRCSHCALAGNSCIQSSRYNGSREINWRSLGRDEGRPLVRSAMTRLIS